MTGGSLRDVGFFVRGRINRTIARLRAGRTPPPLPPPMPLAEVLGGADSPLALTRLLAGRDNAAREAAVARYLETRGAELARHRFDTFEGRGENFSVDVGTGDRVLLLIAHHDAVPGSPGANDNAAAAAILLHLLPRLRVPPSLRVRLLFPACEELGYLGARAYVRDLGVASVIGALSLELCGVGDSVALWDAGEETPLLRTARGALDGIGLRADESYHVVGRIPVFGSDHRAFAAAGVPAYGLTVVPTGNAAALRDFVFRPVRGAIMNLVRRPAPFDTYHTHRDTLTTVDPAALDRVVRALEAIVDAVR